MAVSVPYPDLDELLTMAGEAGYRLSEIDATEGAAGNISVYIGWPVEPRRWFPQIETIALPVHVPGLAGKAFLVTGSGRRLREIIQAPDANMGYITVDDGGATATLYSSYRRRFARLTSELNSHLAIHEDQIARTGTNFHAVIHAQPPHLTYLSHVPAYRDFLYLNRHVLRWEPESIYHLPEGILPIPFRVPGTPALEAATVEGLRAHQVVVWGKHGVVARSDVSIKRASDYIEYAETGARYEYMNLTAGERAEGLTTDEILAICETFGVQQSIFTR